MNYRHAFHAGNFADCFKHALLVWCIGALQRKPRPVFFLDTHAGIGCYDLTSAEAVRSGEFRTGIARLHGDPPPALADYLALAGALGSEVYPGSPELFCVLARAGDRVALAELHQEDAARLRRRYRGCAQVHVRDGYEALGALLPPPERRALVLIDPPYERADEFDRIFETLRVVDRKCRAATVLAWYPIKDRAAPRGLQARLRESGLRDLVAAELHLREPTDRARMSGCGMVVKNPPFGFESAARPILDALRARLCDGEAGAGSELLRLADE